MAYAQGLELRDSPPSGATTPRLRLELQQHQKHNVARFLSCVKFGDGGCLIADDLGLGKTCSSIACVEALREAVKPECRDFKTLFVVPKSVLDQWRTEILKFTFLEASQISLNWSRVGATYQLVTYETLRSAFVESYEKKDRDWVPRFASVHFCFIPDFFRCVVFDEVHRLRNKTAKVHHAAKYLGQTQGPWHRQRHGRTG